MAKRWTDAELRFLRDNAGKMSVQALAETLSVRIDELEKKIEKLGLAGNAESPASKKAQTLKELSKHTENARKDFDRGVSALQRKKVDEAERHFLDLIQKYPDEKELVDRSRVYLAVCERQKKGPRPELTEPEDFYYAAILEKNRGNVAEAIAIVHPFAVDVASGVESSPGRKDPEKLHAFTEAARHSSGVHAGTP